MERLRHCILIAVLCSAALPAQVRLAGRVMNENNAPVPGALVTLKSLRDGSQSETTSDPAGRFQCDVAAPGDYQLSARRDGYFRLDGRAVSLAAGDNEIHLVLSAVREVFESIDVTASSSAPALEEIAPQQTLNGPEILSLPFPSSNSLKNALRLMPGVMQDVNSGVHVHGGAEEQVLFTLNGFTLNDPLTGRFDTRLSVEAVQAVDIVNGRLPAEFGRGAAGMIAISTAVGGDKRRYSATNFVPGLENRKGFFIGNWSPRLNVSGPIRRGRAWFSDSVAAQYDAQVIEDLPAGSDRIHAWRLSNLLQTQVNVTPSHILSGGLLVNGWWAPRKGLNALNPMETTVDQRSRQWFFNLKHQAYLRRNLLLEFGYAANRTFTREIPQGHSFLRLTPDGSSGNAFVDASRVASRDQWLATITLPSFQRLGSHQWKAGVDLDRLVYSPRVSRTGFEQLRSDGTLVRRVVFAGTGTFSQSNFEAGAFVQDSWKLRHDVLVELGLRFDWDTLLGNRNLSPRTGASWMPAALKRTKLHAAYALVYEASNLRLLSRPWDQYFLTTYFAPDGTVAAGPEATVFLGGQGRIATPRARNWSAGVERELAGGALLTLTWFRRRGDHGFVYLNRLPAWGAPPADLVQRFGTARFESIYVPGNARRDIYDSLEVTARKTFRRQFGWMASYTRSRALSTSVLDVSLDDPVTALQNAGPMPWDSPHRFTGWAYLPLFWKDWAVAGFLDWRTGFPFSIQQNSQVIGAVNALRFPAFFELNANVERRFVWRGHRWELRLAGSNITGRRNPNVVNSNVDSPNFMHFYGGQRRSLNVRVRWLGKASQ